MNGGEQPNVNLWMTVEDGEGNTNVVAGELGVRP
jgi:hypothetical protein